MIRALNVDKLRLDMGDFVLSVQGMRKRIGGRDVLERVEIDVKRGALAALVGPAGAGKSLVLACIAGVASPSSGRVRYFGYEIKGRGEARTVRMGIARTHQQPQAFEGMSVLDTVTVGALLRRPLLRRARAYAAEMLELTQLSAQAGARFDALDAAARGRLEIARTLATQPQLLLLDDPAAGLDDAAADALGAIVGAIRARGVTILAAARTLDRRALPADDIITIDRGKTAEIGAHAAVNIHA